MSTSEILEELSALSPDERRVILERLLELDDCDEVVEAHRRSADASFLMLDELEAEDATHAAG